MGSFPHCPFPHPGQPLPTHEPCWTGEVPFPSPNQKAHSHFPQHQRQPIKALLEPATIKRLSLPSLLCHCPSFGPADPGHHKLEAILSRSKSSSGIALFPHLPGTQLLYSPSYTLSSSHSIPSLCHLPYPLLYLAQKHSINPWSALNK